MEAITITIKPEFSPAATLTLDHGEHSSTRTIHLHTDARSSGAPALAVEAARAALRVTCENRSEPSEPAPVGTRWVRCYSPLRTEWQWKPVDVGVADLVEQLQRANGGQWPLEPTAGSCDGHGTARAHVLLADGRVLVVYESLNAAQQYGLTPQT